MLLMSLISCTPDDEQSQKLYRQFNDIPSNKPDFVSNRESHLKEIAREHEAEYIDPYDKQWTHTHTYLLQNSFIGKRVLFEASLVDISRTGEKYIAIFSGGLLVNTEFHLQLQQSQIESLASNEGKSYLVVAKIKSITRRPYSRNNSDDFSDAFNENIYGKSYLITGTLIGVQQEQAPNKSSNLTHESAVSFHYTLLSRSS